MDTVHMDAADFDYESRDDLVTQALERVEEVASEVDANVLAELDVIDAETGEVRVNVGGWDTEVSAFRRRWYHWE